MKKILKLILLFGLPLTLWYCSPRVLPPTESQMEDVVNRYPATDSISIMKGYAVFSESCNRCHALKNPSGYSEEEWHKILPVMTKKAKLSREETELVQAYILAFSKDKIPVSRSSD